MEKCPCCEKDLESITDYPYLNVLSIEEIGLPELIRGSWMGSMFATVPKGYFSKKRLRNPRLPQEVAEDYAKTNKPIIRHNGMIYEIIQAHEEKENKWLIHQDATEFVNEIYHAKEFKKRLEYLKEMNQSVMKTTDFFSSLIFQEFEYKDNKINISYSQTDKKNNTPNVFQHTLHLYSENITTPIQATYNFNVEIANIAYAGFLNQNHIKP